MLSMSRLFDNLILMAIKRKQKKLKNSCNEKKICKSNVLDMDSFNTRIMFLAVKPLTLLHPEGPNRIQFWPF